MRSIVALVCAAAAPAATTPAPTLAPATATLIQTLEKGDRLQEYTVNVTAAPLLGRQTLRIDPTARRQTLLGFGGAGTDAVAHVCAQLSPKLQEEVLEALWGPTGQRYNLARLTIGSTDFSVDVYNYDDLRAEPTAMDWNHSDVAVPQQLHCGGGVVFDPPAPDDA